MIHVYGTSHVSGDSMEVINEKLEEHDPDIVALELDLGRLNALLNGQKSAQGGPMFLKLVKKFQDFIGSKTGVMPGEEMLYAYHKAIAENREVALIDQDIRATINRLETVSKKEKFKAMTEAGAAFVLPGKFDVSEIPGEDMVQRLLEVMEDRYPGLYRVLLAERNQVMADYLRNLQEEEPEAEIVVFVGAAHRKDLEDRLKVEK